MPSVVVTGCGRGIGYAIAETLTARGWTVVGLEVSPESAQAARKVCAEVVVGDSAHRESHCEVAERACALDLLAGWVNNAGITRPTTLHELDDETTRALVNANGLGYIWGCAAAVRAFLDQGTAGAIVNIGSIHGRASFPDHAVYEFTKGGVDALTRSVAVSYGHLGIRANTVAPGGIRTPNLEAAIAGAQDPAAAERMLAAGPPLRRIGEPGEIAGVVAFLLSTDASYLSGQSIAVDGAWTASFGRP